MYDALELLVDFFHANEKGLEMKKITSEQYLVSGVSCLIIVICIKINKNFLGGLMHTIF